MEKTDILTVPLIALGASDIPGHAWKQIYKWHLVGLYYNIDPSGELPFWASGEEAGVLLCKVDAIITSWSEETANFMAKKGYIHYHELVYFDAEGNPIKHPNLVVWLKHTDMRDFIFDGGPPAPFSFPYQVFENRVASYSYHYISFHILKPLKRQNKNSPNLPFHFFMQKRLTHSPLCPESPFLISFPIRLGPLKKLDFLLNIL